MPLVADKIQKVRKYGYIPLATSLCRLQGKNNSLVSPQRKANETFGQLQEKN